jgi:hypothetical protein
VLLSPPGSLRGLTPTQLRLPGLLVEGWPARRVAAALDTTDKDVADRVGTILAAFDAPGTGPPRQCGRTGEGLSLPGVLGGLAECDTSASWRNHR